MLQEQVIKVVTDHLPAENGGSSLEFFLDLSVFPVGSSLGTSRESWKLGFVWLNGMGWTTEELQVTHFEYDLTKDRFDGSFDLGDRKIQLLGDYDPDRKLNQEEIDFLKSFLPDKCKLFGVCVYRPALVKERNGKQTLNVDAIVTYYNVGFRRVPTPLQLAKS